MIAVLEGLYLGGREDARDLRALREEGITHVLNCAVELPNYHEKHLTYLNLRLTDPDVNFRARLPEARGFLDEARRRGSVLVHCFAGVSRSPAIVLAYLCHRELLTLEQAARQLSEVVWTAPDELFLKQLADDLGEPLDTARLNRLMRILMARPDED